MSDFAPGFFVGFFFGFAVMAIITAVSNDGWRSRLVDVGVAHYDTITGKWQLDAEQSP